MSPLQSSPLPLKHRPRGKGPPHLVVGTGVWPLHLTPEEADRLGSVLHEWAAGTQSPSPPSHPPGWHAEPRALGRWRRRETVTRVALVVGILFCAGLVGTVGYARSTTTTLSFSYVLSGPSAIFWNVTMCRNTPTEVAGGGQAWDCSMVLWNADLTNNSVEYVSVAGAGIDNANTLPFVVLPLNFMAFTIVGHTPTFGGTQNVVVTIDVGS